MIPRWTTRKSRPVSRTPAYTDIQEWVLSLPWVVERPTDGSRPGVRLFAVDCPPLERRQLWLVTGLGQTLHDDDEGTGIAAVMPVAATRTADSAGWELHRATPLPADHVLVTFRGDVGRDEIDALILEAYSHAMS
jgi:hypothetical protein